MKAKEVIVEKWLNTPDNFNLSLADGKIKILYVFQMLCTGCVYYSIPQLMKLFEEYKTDQLQVLALHSVFEDHETMNEASLRRFINEWKLKMPVAIDKALPGDWMPATMRSYHLQGTPSLIVIDGKGELRLCYFGHVEYSALCKFLDKLIEESSAIKLTT